MRTGCWWRQWRRGGGGVTFTEWQWGARCAVSAVVFVGAAYVASKGQDGWGWLIFAGLLSLPTLVR